jgi:hypothetical protein
MFTKFLIDHYATLDVSSLKARQKVLADLDYFQASLKSLNIGVDLGEDVRMFLKKKWSL